jgi:hypothetical protein
MTILNITSRTNDAGEVHLQLGVPNSDVSITVEIQDASKPARTKEEWELFVKRTGGSIADSGFRRHPQGEFSIREFRK